MDATLDHVVLWTDDPLRAVAFYTDVVGFAPVRVDEFKAGSAPFPSVRVAERTILDLMARVAAPVVEAMSGVQASAGHPVNHVCFAMSERDFESLRTRLAADPWSTAGLLVIARVEPWTILLGKPDPVR